ncbi:hypothetical protein HD806DRAFT_478114 [Xylariaceae sp. AK1471]|nr:hypothetical protein HD806DRAFT_478114 [Xylariaceae sp. AK1471]
MKFLHAIVAQLGVAWALPSQLEKSQIYVPCPNAIYDKAFCCAVGALDDDISCESPSITPISASDFQNICSYTGMRARCCQVPIIGYDWFLCQIPSGVSPYHANSPETTIGTFDFM